MVRQNILAVCFLGVSSLWPFQASAQSANPELTVEEITAAFKKQKTRGLVIVPSSGTSSTTATDSGQEVATVATAAAEEYSPVDRKSQINVQISFDFDSAALRADQQPKLVNMCKSMQLMEGTVFQIIGHTDSSGSVAYNERLSLLRAQEVRRYLIGNCDIPEQSLKAIGMGETAPFNETDTRADENRRVEFQALG